MKSSNKVIEQHNVTFGNPVGYFQDQDPLPEINVNTLRKVMNLHCRYLALYGTDPELNRFAIYSGKDDTGESPVSLILNVQRKTDSLETAKVQFYNRAPGATEAIYEFDTVGLASGGTCAIKMKFDDIPTSTSGSTARWQTDGRLVRQVSSIRYKDLVDTDIPIDILKDAVIKNFTLKSDKLKTISYGVIAEEIAELVGEEYADVFTFKNKAGQIENVHSDNIKYCLFEYLLDENKTGKTQIIELEDAVNNCNLTIDTLQTQLNALELRLAALEPQT